uniref:hypothetical protein n=1 Tax=Salmonella enterica TaxID=28901 RepID=UPI0020C35EC2
SLGSRGAVYSVLGFFFFSFWVLYFGGVFIGGPSPRINYPKFFVGLAFMLLADGLVFFYTPVLFLFSVVVFWSNRFRSPRNNC